MYIIIFMLNKCYTTISNFLYNNNKGDGKIKYFLNL